MQMHLHGAMLRSFFSSMIACTAACASLPPGWRLDSSDFVKSADIIVAGTASASAGLGEVVKATGAEVAKKVDDAKADVDQKIDQTNDKVGDLEQRIGDVEKKQEELIQSFRKLSDGVYEFLNRGAGLQGAGASLSADVGLVPWAQARDGKTGQLVIAGETRDGRKRAWAGKFARTIQALDATDSIETSSFEELSLTINEPISSNQLDVMVNPEQPSFGGNNMAKKGVRLLVNGAYAFLPWPGWLSAAQIPSDDRLPDLVDANMELYVFIRPEAVKDSFYFQERKSLSKFAEDGTLLAEGQDLDPTVAHQGFDGRIKDVTAVEGGFSFLIQDGSATPSIRILSNSHIRANKR